MTEKISLQTGRQLYEVVDEAIKFHVAIKDGLANAVVWNNVVPTKKGGVLCMNTLLEARDYSSEQRREINENLKYWKANYEALRRQVFYRKRAIVSLSEKENKR